MKICPKCNIEHNKQGIFCSRSCANSRIWSEESKKKRGETLKKFIKDNPSWIESQRAASSRKIISLRKTLHVKNLQSFLDGNIKDRAVLKKWIINTHIEKCNVCGIGPEWNNMFLSLQVDHIDGNNTNNLPENLRLVCPNCHSQTPTFAGKKR